MWATDGASPIGRALGAGLAAMCLAGTTMTAPAATPDVAEADIERARQQHRMPTDAEVARIPVPGAPRIDKLPQPVTRVPVDLEAIAKGFDLKTGTQAAAMNPGKAGPKVLIFVSFAMPEATLQRLVDQAARARVTLVLRGLVNGSIRDTVARTQALMGNRRVGVQIDPQAFDRYGVARTPTFVLVRGDAKTEGCASGQCAMQREYAKVSGDVSLAYAMRHLLEVDIGDANPPQRPLVVPPPER